MSKFLHMCENLADPIGYVTNCCFFHFSTYIYSCLIREIWRPDHDLKSSGRLRWSYDFSACLRGFLGVFSIYVNRLVENGFVLS